MNRFEVKYRRRNRRGKRWAMVAAVVAVAYLCIAAAVMLLSPNSPASSGWSAAADAPAEPVEPQAAVPAATPPSAPVPAPNAQDAGTARPALSSPPVGQRSLVFDARSARAASPKPVKVAAIKTTEPHGYLVQVAAVPDLQEAQAVLEQLAEAGHPAYLTAKTVNGIELYRVRLGPFTLRPAAEEVARRLEREGHRAPWVTR